MVEHLSGMENISVLVLDEDPTSLLVITKMLEKHDFKVFPFLKEHAALDFLKKEGAKEEEIDLILAEVHVSTMATRTLKNSELISHIMNKLHVPFVSMCTDNDKEAISESLAIGAWFHLLKPLTTESFSMLKQIAGQHKSRRATLKVRHLKGQTCSAKRDRLTWEAHGHPKKLGPLIWTVELQKKFLEAIEVLGDKYAVPSRIIKLMNVKNLTVKQIASRLQRHRSRAKQHQGQFRQNASTEPGSELLRSAHDASTAVSVTPRVASDIREGYPSRLLTNVKKMPAEAMSLKVFRDDTRSVWDKYDKIMQNRLSSRRWEYEQFAESKDVAGYEGISSEGPETAGEIGYGVPFENQFHQNVSTKPGSELLRSAHDASATVSITCRDVANIREVYPSRTYVKKISAEAVALKAYSHLCTSEIFRDDTKSVWDKYHKSLQNQLSSREQSAKSKDVARYEGISREGPETAGEIGYGVPFESSGSNSLLTSYLGQTRKNNLTETAVTDPADGRMHLQGNDAQLNDTNKSSNAQMYLAGPDDDQEEMNSFWLSHMNAQEQLNIRPEDLLQIDEAWNEALAWGTQPSPVNVVVEPITQEAIVEDSPVPDPVMQFTQTQEAAAGDALVPDPVMQFELTQETTVGDAPVQFAPGDFSPFLYDHDMTLLY